MNPTFTFTQPLIPCTYFQRAGKVYINYNLGSKDITVGDIAAKVNDGKYHVVRFSRSGANSTLQIDDNPPQERFPLGENYS